MPKIQRMILGPNRNAIVTDGRTLNGMEKRGHFVRVHRDHPYVNEEHRPRTFVWHKQRYRIEYFDGCFYPFVVKSP